MFSLLQLKESFLYSQDLSNRKTALLKKLTAYKFLYSQDLSNRKTVHSLLVSNYQFLYSQDLSNRKTNIHE